MATYLITGASRGLGLEFVKQILENQPNSKVIAAARKPTESSSLVSLQKKYSERLSFVVLSVDQGPSVKAAAQQVTKTHPEGIDYLINNAGIMGPDKSDTEDFQTFNTNVQGPLRVFKEFLPLIKKGNKKTVITISSLMGSIAAQGKIKEIVKVFSPSADYYDYRISKAAANAAIAILAEDHRSEGITIVSVHPGLVNTDMFSSSGADPEHFKGTLITPTTSASGVLQVLHKLTIESTGKFFNYDGSNLPF